MKERLRHLKLLAAILLMAGAIVALLILGTKKPGQQQPQAGHADNPSVWTRGADAPSPLSWMQAVQKVKEDRGEPTGKQARVETPRQLRHYSDTRRFLAVQVAEWREHRFDTPRDYVELASMLKAGEMVELRAVSDDYILLGVGGNADTAAFTRFENGRRITLYNEETLAREYERLAESRAKIEDELLGLKKELDSLNKRDRQERAKLQARINASEKLLKAERENVERLEHYYGDAERRGQLFRDYESLEALAKSFSGRTYDLENAPERREMKVRMLSALRPAALKVLEEVAASYRQQFGRPLPVTSLVRPAEYQQALSRVNSNATRIQTPPHSTGLAFDIYYRFMTAEEQSFVMDYLARLKDEGRIEVLRENRDCYHVFAFVDGARPAESLIQASMKRDVRPEAEKADRASE